MYIVNAVVNCSILVILFVGCDAILALTVEISRISTMVSSGWLSTEMFLGSSIDIYLSGLFLRVKMRGHKMAEI